MATAGGGHGADMRSHDESVKRLALSPRCRDDQAVTVVTHRCSHELYRLA
ncbi:uncharacterized protein PGTG_16052 [Puccinia graminis f. sp. tritici CRL 75-36-700-3]|uniref:Uncharacterized protein n=1 Tax=Puccinia graminis f. sp. tritici (strain CRL 75-36-700-3 / race SCCL) TaxID=418459 RepID=E3L1P0_PUCGT|nr:uncharacterized protein PGTG_16052 [Puccinia graminis f. sp. tritici CRL 75-36-700-3]EFP90465.2 hypothetical protein PGTG_16052 [Puccinia graminis f. sp. tritici CRL 75-36-700-3]